MQKRELFNSWSGVFDHIAFKNIEIQKIGLPYSVEWHNEMAEYKEYSRIRNQCSP